MPRQRGPSSSRRHNNIAGFFLGLLTVSSLWLPAVQAQKASDYFVHSLPGAPEGVPLVKMHAGHVEVSHEHNGNLFFWHFQNKHLADKPRTVIWLNGGPGCSSEDGALMEIGPYRVREGGNLELVDGSWNEFANLLFLDNPVGTGFSFVDGDSYVHELNEMADQVVLFLEKFFGMFPDYLRDDIYIAGESYAGQHIPYIAKAMLERNKRAKSDETWNLQGLLIGNGWISGVDQYPSYLQYAYKAGLLKPGTPEADSVERAQAQCDKALSNGGKDRVDTDTCEGVLNEILKVTTTMKDGTQMCTNMYDVRLTDTYPSCGMSWPPDLKDVEPYLRRKDVTEALHVSPQKKSGWTECNGDVGGAFKARKSVPSVQLLPDLLSQIPILLFSGDQDLICNHLGTEELIHNLSFNGGTGFELSPGVWAPRRQWTFENEPAGLYQEARNLTYVLFYNSSHMVPFDYPRRTRDMLDRFLGVDISAIGGAPSDSRLDGEPNAPTSVAGHSNETSPAAQDQQAASLQAAEWKAYRRAGELALVVVSIAAACWGWFVYRQRKRMAGYRGVAGGDPAEREESGLGMAAAAFGRMKSGGVGSGRHGMANGRRGAGNDIEAADFDENELDDFGSDEGGRRYSLGGDSEEEDGGKEGRGR